MSVETSPTTLFHTPLHELHVGLGARMVPFAGYEMPVQYGPGVLKEHLHTRAEAGLFDVSHMGQIAIRARSGTLAGTALALERLVPSDVLGIAPGRQRYALFTNAEGGIRDDLMIANCGDHFLLVVNAATKRADFDLLRDQLASECEVEALDRALLALQGPRSEAALARFAPDCAHMRFMDVREASILGAPMVVARSGYTGEDGFEISIPSGVAREIAEALLAVPGVQPIGLGARDSLRLEAGLPLYGADIDTATTPVEAGLAWSIGQARRAGGVRAGGYPGAGVIARELERGAARARVGLRPEGRAPVRQGAPLFADRDRAEPVGLVTSGGYGPSVGAPVAMGYVPARLAASGTRLHAEVRGEPLPVLVAPLPFVRPHQKRGAAA